VHKYKYNVHTSVIHDSILTLLLADETEEDEEEGSSSAAGC
jgi:hypothetical protein